MRTSILLPLAALSSSLLSSCVGNFTLSQSDLSSLSVNSAVNATTSGEMTLQLFVTSRGFLEGGDCPVLDPSTTATLDGVALDVDRGGANLPAGCRTPTIRGRFTTPTGGAGELVFADATSTIHVTAPALGATLWMEPGFDTTAMPRSGPWTFSLPAGDGLADATALLGSTCAGGNGAYDAATGQVVISSETMTCPAGVDDPLTASVGGVLTTTLDERPVATGLSGAAVDAAPVAPPSCTVDQDCIDLGAGTTCSGGFCNNVPGTAVGLSFSSAWNRTVRWAP